MEALTRIRGPSWIGSGSRSRGGPAPPPKQSAADRVKRQRIAAQTRNQKKATETSNQVTDRYPDLFARQKTLKDNPWKNGERVSSVFDLTQHEGYFYNPHKQRMVFKLVFTGNKTYQRHWERN